MGNGITVPLLILTVSLVRRQRHVLWRQLQKGLAKWGRPVLTMDGTTPGDPDGRGGHAEGSGCPGTLLLCPLSPLGYLPQKTDHLTEYRQRR